MSYFWIVLYYICIYFRIINVLDLKRENILNCFRTIRLFLSQIFAKEKNNCALVNFHYTHTLHLINFLYTHKD